MGEPDPLADRRTIELLGGPLPADHAEAVRALRAAVVLRRDQRRKAEAEVATLGALERSAAQAQLDRRLRTSPELERQRRRGEQLTARLHRARHASDSTMLGLNMVSRHFGKEVAAANRTDAEPQSDDDEGGDVLALPGMREMLAMRDRFLRQRGRTDLIGTRPDGDGAS